MAVVAAAAWMAVFVLVRVEEGYDEDYGKLVVGQG
jgi:hypothetical protein